MISSWRFKILTIFYDFLHPHPPTPTPLFFFFFFFLLYLFFFLYIRQSELRTQSFRRTILNGLGLERAPATSINPDTRRALLNWLLQRQLDENTQPAQRVHVQRNCYLGQCECQKKIQFLSRMVFITQGKRKTQVKEKLKLKRAFENINLSRKKIFSMTVRNQILNDWHLDVNEITVTYAMAFM